MIRFVSLLLIKILFRYKCLFLFEFIYSIELLSFDNQKIDNYTFDPLNIYNNKSIEEKNKIKNIEKNIGRYAMIGITYIFYNEYISLYFHVF